MAKNEFQFIYQVVYSFSKELEKMQTISHLVEQNHFMINFQLMDKNSHLNPVGKVNGVNKSKCIPVLYE